MQFKKLSEVIRPSTPKVLIYGGSGTGKTTSIASLPGRVVILSAESGLLPLAPIASDPRFDVAEIATMDDVRAAYKAIKQSRSWDWVVVDSLSEIAEVVLSHLEQRKGASGEEMHGKSNYNDLFKQTVQIVRSFRDLQDVGVVVLCKEQVLTDKEGSVIGLSPSMPGKKLGPALPYLFDEVFRSHVLTKTVDGVRHYEFVLQTRRTARIEAKDRSGALDDVEPFDLGALVEKITAAARGATPVVDGTPAADDHTAG
jgi:hypothetical protein